MTRRCSAVVAAAVVLGGFACGARASGLDPGAWEGTLKACVREGRVDYKALKASPGRLDEYLEQVASLKEADYARWGRSDRIAFWINAYNALTLKAVLERYPIRASFAASLLYPRNSIRQIPGVWDKLRFSVMGRSMSLDEIEHGTLRRLFREPRVHMALVCASVGCPPLRGGAYTGAGLDEQLDDQARRFLAAPDKFRIDRGASRVYLSPIFKWFGGDFAAAEPADAGFGNRPPAERAVLSFISRRVSADDARYLREGAYTVKYLDYDWSLNERPSP